MPEPASDPRIIAPHPRIAARLIGGRALILDPRTDALQRLNEVGSFVWGLIAERRHDRAALCVAVVEAFEVEADAAAADLDVFLDALEAKGLIVRGAPGSSAQMPPRSRI